MISSRQIVDRRCAHTQSGYLRTNDTGSLVAGTRWKVFWSFSSKRQGWPLAGLSSNSPRSICQVAGAKRATKASHGWRTWTNLAAGVAWGFVVWLGMYYVVLPAVGAVTPS